MSDAAIQFLVDNLKQLVVDKAYLITNVRRQVESLTRDLPNLKAFIEDSTEQSHVNKVVKELVTEIRVLTCEVEDAIEAFVVGATDQKAKKWLQKMFRGFDPEYKLREVAEKVQTTRTKVQKMYVNPIFGFETLQGRESRYPAGRSWIERRFYDIEKDSVVGFEYATTELIDRLCGETKDLQVISIIGMGGLGKTTLARLVYNDPRVSYEFSNRVWIHVPQTYNKEDLFLSILARIARVVNTYYMDDEDSLALTQKYLIVLDDVPENTDWDGIKRAFPNRRNRSRILLTTRNELVTMHADPCCLTYNLKFLPDYQSWELLLTKVFGRGEFPPDLWDVGRRIARQCDGLPLAIVVISGILEGNKSKGWWETIAKRVNPFLLRYERDLMEVLALSYHHLPPHLKACFLYFGVFPKDYEIPAWILIRLWIAEGFIQKNENVCLEEMAEDHLFDMVARNLVLVGKRSFDGRIKTCRIHDMLHDLCLKEALAENFLFEIKGLGSNSSYHLNPDVSIMNRRLCIHSGVLNYISSKPFGPRVRSFLCFAKDQVYLTHKQVGYISKEFKLLRVLHIRPIITSHLFPSEIEQLAHLRYVAISGDFTTIPANVSNIWNLETLIVVTSSPTIDIQANILKMLHLRHLHTNVASQLHGPVVRHDDTVPISGSLRTLDTITPQSCTEAVLGQIPFIKKLVIRGDLSTLRSLPEENGLHCFNDLLKLRELVTLKLLNEAVPSESLPKCYKFPPNLRRLTLAGTFLSWEHMPVLGMLLELEELKLKDNAFTGPSWKPLDGGFKELKTLHIWKTGLKDWEANADHFPKLQHILLSDCSELIAIPYNLSNLPTLQTIKLYQTSPSVANSARKIRQHQIDIKMDNVVNVDIYPPDH